MTTKKNNKKGPRGIYPAVVLSAFGVQNILRPRKIQAEIVQILKVGDLSYLLRVCDDNINQDMTCLITLFVRDEERDEIIILIIA